LSNHPPDTVRCAAEEDASTDDAVGKHIPGEAGVWILIVGDLVVFALFFFTFLYYRTAQPDVFGQSQRDLNRGLGLVNTIVLLTSSLFVAMGVRRARAGTGNARALMMGAAACGVVFAVIKSVEYWEKISAGVSMSTNLFFTLYFAFTGIHLLHVVVGTGVLVFIAKVAARVQGRNARKMDVVVMESGASFWHLVDILWIVLFSLLYLV
jgi:nitric oxide reductase NorE protein